MAAAFLPASTHPAEAATCLEPVMTDDFDRNDIGQMRKDGDLREFMRSQMRRPADVREFPEAVAPQSRADGRPVGAWPLGAHKPGCPVFGIPDGQQCECPTT